MLNESPANRLELETSSTECPQGAPFAAEFIKVLRQDMIQLKADRNRYKSLHQRTLLKVKALEEALALEKGKVRDLNHRLYGKKTEKGVSKPDQLPSSNDFVRPPRPKAKRGAREGRANRPRHQHPDLPVKEGCDPNIMLSVTY